MKKLITLAALLLISSSVFASLQVVHSDKNFSTEAFPNKSEAYEAGFTYLDNINNLSESELKHKLLVISQSTVHDVKINNSKVSIEEFAQARGEIVYRAVIDVDYQFTRLRNNN
ncbi:DUF3316 domain-containing protein [Psychromonas sp. SP041]|uniref:DUF3316 domain-containing protein n=1 Tax=Psychromonas sp. SP041 TaxID=1365007 RepID=UPI00041BA1F1|nr:DUF3316 domain-containing protein [Psychromonas sp. SP041]